MKMTLFDRRLNARPHFMCYLLFQSMFFLSFLIMLHSVLIIFIATLSLYLGTLSAARNLHNYLLRNVIRAPMTTFFDITPAGRIINRFSHDVDTVDNEFPATIRAFSSCFFAVQFNRSHIDSILSTSIRLFSS